MTETHSNGYMVYSLNSFKGGLYRGLLNGVLRGMKEFRLYIAHMGIMEKKMETTIEGLGVEGVRV